MKKLRSVFFGTPDFSLPSLEACRESTELLFVVSQPDKPRGRGMELSPSPVKAKALEWGLPVFTPASLKKDSPELHELKNFLQNNRPDLFVVTAYGNLLPQLFLDFPVLGSINVHASLLPQWRGAAPIQRALEAGDNEGGICLQKMVMALDAGDVLLEKRLALDESITAPELWSAYSQMGGELLKAYLSSAPSELKGSPQDESKVSFAAKLTKEEGLWDPAWTATQTHNRVRAFNPWPAVKAQVEGGPVFKLLKTSLVRTNAKAEAGIIDISDKKVTLGCEVRPGEQPCSLSIEKIQPENRGAQEAHSFFRNLMDKAGSQRLRLVKAKL